jgi:hypothetical protein
VSDPRKGESNPAKHESLSDRVAAGAADAVTSPTTKLAGAPRAATHPPPHGLTENAARPGSLAGPADEPKESCPPADPGSLRGQIANDYPQ